MPHAAPSEAENVEQPTTIVTHRRLEVNPQASAAWMRRLSGHAVLAGDEAANTVSNRQQALAIRRRNYRVRIRRCELRSNIICVE
ncbi:MAG: hypothetical protein H6821_01005 [Planctomycetaceae bacterium]|nr:hypothetical protein [Planctomycetales bacterium]MCB9872729.1 hypothetical protein [Planctomycetaceae bacterium]MCB9926215.1 hypothetical protein [Planctomycetaceae bacterium]